jgi:DNA polymerase III subunit gamma/tau
MSWYRQYRPTTVQQLHLTSARQTLQDMMANGSFPHAFLFAGPKGTGKTSSARIIAAILNDPVNAAAVDHLFFARANTKSTKSAKPLSFQEPTQDDELVQRIQRGASYVVFELDAASNRGIDDIRQLKERIFLPPQEGKVSVYILDEAHMLTTEAFNALLKILEEPPSHVVFILATTELHKIPETIISRCAIVRFQKASQAEITAAMEQILAAEKITYETEALQQLAQVADGSFRDAVKLLELVAAGKQKIAVSDVEQVVQGTQEIQIQKLLQSVLEKKEQEVVQFFIELRQSGTDPKFFYTQLMAFLHQQLLVAITQGDKSAHFSAKIAHYLLTQFASVGVEVQSSIPFLGLELKALEMIFKSKEKNGSGAAVSGSTKTESTKSSPIAEVAAPVMTDLKPQQPAETQSETISSHRVSAQQVIEKWDDFLAMVRQKNSSIEALLRSSKPIHGDSEKTKIEVYYQFHREQLQQPKFRLLLDECSQALFGGSIAFEFLLAESARPGAELSTVSGQVNEAESLIQLAKEILV